MDAPRPVDWSVLKPVSPLDRARRARRRSEAVGAVLAAAVAIGALGYTSQARTSPSQEGIDTSVLARVSDMPAPPPIERESMARPASSPVPLAPTEDRPAQTASPELEAALLSVQASSSRASNGLTAAMASALTPVSGAVGGSSGFGSSAPGVTAAQVGLSLTP